MTHSMPLAFPVPIRRYLSADQLSDYRRDGFLVSAGLFRADLVMEAAKVGLSGLELSTAKVADDDSRIWRLPKGAESAYSRYVGSRRISARAQELLGSAGEPLEATVRILATGQRRTQWKQAYEECFPGTEPWTDVLSCMLVMSGMLKVRTLIGAHVIGRLSNLPHLPQLSDGAPLGGATLGDRLQKRFVHFETVMAPGDVVFMDRFAVHIEDAVPSCDAAMVVTMNIAASHHWSGVPR